MAAAGPAVTAVSWDLVADPTWQTNPTREWMRTLVARTSSDYGQTWGPVQTVATGFDASSALAAAASATATVAVSAQPTGTPDCHNGVRCAQLLVSRLTGGAWTSTPVLLGSTFGDWAGQLRYLGGRFFLALTLDLDTSAARHLLLRSDDEGVSWRLLALPAPVTQREFVPALTDVVGSGAHIAVVMVDRTGDDVPVVVTSSSDAGDHFTAPVTVGHTDWPWVAGAAQLADTVVVAWDDPDGKLQLARSTDAGATFAATQPPAAGLHTGERALLTATTTEFQLLAVGAAGEYRRYVSADGVSWSRVPAPVTHRTLDSVAVAGDRLYVTAFGNDSAGTPAAGVWQVWNTTAAVPPPQVPTIDGVFRGWAWPGAPAVHSWAGDPTAVLGRAPASSTVELVTEDPVGTATYPVTADAYGQWSFTAPLAYDTVIVARNQHGASAPQTIHVPRKVNLDSARYEYTDQRGRCVVRVNGGVYPYIPAAPVYIREDRGSGAGVPVGSAVPTQYGMSGRYSVLFGLRCHSFHWLYATAAGRGPDGRVYNTGPSGPSGGVVHAVELP